MPHGAVQADRGRPIEGALRVELERALAAADRANNASIQETAGRWTVQGDPTEGALLVAARKCGLSGTRSTSDSPAWERSRSRQSAS